MGRKIGIDLGTTNCVVAVYGLNGFKIIQNRENEQMTRSVAGCYKGNILIGTPALNRWPMAPKDTVISIKRLMGRASSDPEVEKMRKNYLFEIVEPSDGTRDSVCVKLGGNEYTPVEISAMILKKLKEDTEFTLGEEVAEAVITVPAYFSDKQIAATREAGAKAGLKVLKIINEPTAAAIAYGLESSEKDAKAVLVYDLGGGTFDISVLMMTAGTNAILNKEGDMWLGGDDFDKIIADYVIEQLKKEFGIKPEKDLRFMATLNLEAKKAKETLSAASAALIMIPGILHDSEGNMIDVDMEISREYFEEKAMPLVKKTVALTEKAIENAHLSMEDIDYVLMAGSSTCIPLVQQTMEKLFGSEKMLRTMHPKNCVAQGAAMVALTVEPARIKCKCGHMNAADARVCEKCGCPFEEDVKPRKLCGVCRQENDADAEVCSECGKPLVFPDIAPFSYGIQTDKDEFAVFIEKNAMIPTPENERRFQEFGTNYKNQRVITIPVFGGDKREKASANDKQGEACAMLPPGLPAKTKIMIRLWLNEDGSFDISAQLEDGTDLRPRILRGGRDQKAEEKIRQVGERLAKEDILSKKRRSALESEFDDIIDQYNKGEMDSALASAEELNNKIDEQDPGKDKNIIKQAKQSSDYAKYLVHEYGWLIGTDTYELNNLIAALDNAISKVMPGAGGEISETDKRLVKDKKTALDREIDDILDDNHLLGNFLVIHDNIYGFIKLNDLILAKQLTDELGLIEVAFKNKDTLATQKLNEFISKYNRTVKEIRDNKNKPWKCPLCHTENGSGSMRCSNPDCTYDLSRVNLDANG